MSTNNEHLLKNADIMVVEDNTADLKFLADILTKAGYRVRPASDGELALRSMRAKLPDLILLDMKLPGVSGIEICRSLKTDPATKDLPVIFISALGETNLKVEALGEGGVDYITKPIDPPEVLARIKTHLKIHRLQQRLVFQSEELVAEINERKQVEKALRELHGELEQRVEDRTKALKIANAELSQYSHVVAHDLKAPLRAIHNYSDFLREDLEDTLDDEQKGYLDGLNLAVGQGEQLVNDLLTLSRIGSAGAVSGAIDMGAFFLELVGVLDLPDNVELSLSDDLPVVKADKTLLSQIFQNLIENAVKFNDSPVKRIRIGRSDTEGADVEFFVHDNGIGIESRFSDKIFLIFQRLHTRQEYEGTGVGLAIVKKALDKLGGSVRVESEPGRGSTFFVSIPEK